MFCNKPTQRQRVTDRKLKGRKRRTKWKPRMHSSRIIIQNIYATVLLHSETSQTLTVVFISQIQRKQTLHIPTSLTYEPMRLLGCGRRNIAAYYPASFAREAHCGRPALTIASSGNYCDLAL